MRTLSQSTGKPPIFIEKAISNWWKICGLSHLIAVAYICIIIQPDYNERTKVSENALLPALVTERFTYHQRISAFLKSMQLESDLPGYIKQQLEAYAITTQMFKFSVTLPGFNESGSDVIGVVRASRSSSVEAILVAVSVSRENLDAVAVVLALATYCREQIYWARDIHFLFVDKGLTGVTAYLAEYHGHRHLFLQTDRLNFHSGAIVGAFALKTRGSMFDTINIEHNMVNGLLPNLDLINLIVRLADKFGLASEVFNHGYQNTWFDLAETAGKAILNQAFNEGEGLHSVFGPYGIQAVTVHAKTDMEDHATLMDLARICEGALRSLNNILEKFHQSYFLYILVNTRHFLSVAYYMPALALVLFPLLILALREWFNLEEFNFPNSLVLLHFIGIIQYCLIRTVATSQTYHSNIFLLSLTTFVPFYFISPTNEKELASLKFLFYLDYCLVFASLSLLNFSLAYIISVVTVPLIILFTVVSIKNRVVSRFKALFGFLLHPLIVFLLCRYFLYSITPSEAYVRDLLKNLMRNHFLYGSFLLPFIFICLLPLWNLLILVASKPVVHS